MANATLSDIPEYFNADFFRTALESGLRMTGLQVLDINIENITLGGENYCSNIYRIKAKYRNEQEHGDEMSLIVKSMPKQRQGVLTRLNIYAKETLFYLDIKPKLEALMWHASEPWHFAARHYYSTTQPDETIVLEDLTAQQFVLKSRQVGLDMQHALLVMQKLAQYHACTMLMAEKEPQNIIARYPFGLLNLESIKAEPFKALFGAQLLKLAGLVADNVAYKEISRKLLSYYDSFTEHVLKAVYPLRGHINVLNHGDLWVNNIFFKYDNMHALHDVRLIDFQLCFYGSPGFDINYFLNTSVQLDVLQNQRHTLIEAYYAALIDTLRQLPYRKAPPQYDELLQEIQQREAYGFFVAFGFFPLMSMCAIDSQDNSLENFHDKTFSRRKIELMFESNERTMQTLMYALRRLDDLGVLG